MVAVATIKELWVYPIKSCSGVSVDSAKLSSTGFELDRKWCVVDRLGTNISQNEAISGRKMPVLTTIAVGITADSSALTLDAAGMPQISIPIAVESYARAESLRAECSGKSTTSGEGWSLGFIEGKVHSEASAWLNEFLNGEVEAGKYRSGFKHKTQFALVRGLTKLELSKYPEIFPLISRSKVEPCRDRFEGNAKVFADFAPLLLLSRASNRFIGERMDGPAYPDKTFRGNIIVDGAGLEPWAEETWGQIEVVSSAGRQSVPLWKVKECPRCSFPCRDPATGKWLYPEDKLRLWKVLRKAFPRKHDDADWGSWFGVFSGVYFGGKGHEGTLSVGDSIEVVERVNWDDHMRGRFSRCTVLGVGAAAAVVAIVATTWTRSARSR